MIPTKLHWKKNFFAGQYQLYSNNRQVGMLKNRIFSQTADAELNEKKYIFKTNGFLKQKTEIIDIEDKKLVGEIQYNSFRTKATIIAGETTIHWKFDNMWNSKWSMNGPNGIDIRSSATYTSGQIDSNTENELLVLSGLFINDFYSQTSIAVLIAVFIPIFVSTLH